MIQNKMRDIIKYEFSLQNEYIKKVQDILKENFIDTIPLAYVKTYGCQQNVNDSERIQGMLLEMGFGLTDDKDSADFILYNTCAIRENAEEKVFGNLGALKHNKKRNGNLIIGFCGCMAQQDHVVERIKNSYPYVDLVFGTHSLQNFPELLYKKLCTKKRVFDVQKVAGFITEGMPIKRDGTLKGWLSIMYGCNKFCTYCVVPHVRGRERSRQPEEILKEFRQMLSEGFKDITLLGQNVNSYGLDLKDNEINFAKLMDMLSKEEGDFRLRFMTSHPKDFDEELVDVIANNDKICNHIHLPVQCGNDRILKLMNRHYNKEEYIEKINYAKSKIKDVSFTSDIIVGFPGETYEEFLETIDLIKEVEYTSLFMFIYSKREGTRAALLEDNITHKEKSKWFTQLLEAQRVIGKKMYDKYIGKTVKVLVEDYGKTGENFLTGKSEANIQVDFIGDKSLIGTFIDVKITDNLNWVLLGEKLG